MTLNLNVRNFNPGPTQDNQVNKIIRWNTLNFPVHMHDPYMVASFPGNVPVHNSAPESACCSANHKLRHLLSNSLYF